ncbi:DinB family protein [Pseudomonas sp.]|uniref:DinB family protein n=1 Tax=Pseudomonas sp. TaxID=306 RepID=UPI00272B8816|nr:DinB family protein [Pseudomonas sp.]
MTPQTALLMAKYNRWMNERVYEAAASLPESAVVADMKAFFGSIFGTLNHIAVADTIWLHRFSQQDPSFPSLKVLSELPHPASLRQALAEDLSGLREYRSRLDNIIEQWAAELTADRLSGDISYANTAGVTFRRNLGALVQHFFNHQTHHRGQVSTLLFQCGVDVGVTDLLALIPSDDA